MRSSSHKEPVQPAKSKVAEAKAPSPQDSSQLTVPVAKEVVEYLEGLVEACFQRLFNENNSNLFYFLVTNKKKRDLESDMAGHKEHKWYVAENSHRLDLKNSFETRNQQKSLLSLENVIRPMLLELEKQVRQTIPLEKDVEGWEEIAARIDQALMHCPIGE